MSITSRIFLSCLAVVCLCLYYPLRHLADAVSIHYREGVEDVLVDQANMLAEVVEEDMRRSHFSAEKWERLFVRMQERVLSAKIYDLDKNKVDANIYITDQAGTVLFDSATPSNAGKDFSRWRDVWLTLRGQYGARSTRVESGNDAFSVLHVAAPIYVDGIPAGVLTVAKPTTNIRYFVDGARQNIQKSGLLALFGAGLLSFLLSVWIARPIRLLTRYAKGIRDGENPRFPHLGKSEIGELGRALAEMQESLEGKRYVEEYVQHLTHELKSPLSAIRGAAELLSEPMDSAQQQRFIANINNQSKRIQEITDRMLELASLESRSYQRADEELSAPGLLAGVLLSKEPLLAARGLHISTSAPKDLLFRGDAFLLHQALANLIQNAVDFSPAGGCIDVTVNRDGNNTVFTVSDQGPGLPEYAKLRVFEKFFSLQRPASGQKSTGLGLNFVRQVALLHEGNVTLSNRPEGSGAIAVLTLP